MPEFVDSLQDRTIILIKLLLLKFSEHTLEVIQPGEVDSRDKAIETLSKFFQCAELEQVQNHLRLNKSEVHAVDLPAYIVQHKTDSKKKQVAYELLEKVLQYNEELELVDIVGSDQRLRDGLMKKQIDSGMR